MIAALQCPCPSRYNDKAPANDRQRLERLWRKRRSRAKLTPAEDGGLARLNARYMAFASGPEARARARIDAFREKDRRFRNGTGPRMGRRERAELRGLATLYPREIPEIDEEFLVRESVFSERPLRKTAIDGRTTRHSGYRTSQICRKRIEEVFGWIKAQAGLAKVKLRECAKIEAIFTFTVAAYNLIRLPKLLTAAA